MQPKALWTIAAAGSLTLAACAEILRDERSQAERPVKSGQTSPQNAPRIALERDLVRDVQQQLQAKGVDPGPIDGIWGPQTHRGIKQFQQAQGLSPSGQLDAATLSALKLPERPRASSASSTQAESASGGTSGSRYERLFERVDKNNDGVVSREEFNDTLGAPRSGAEGAAGPPSFRHLDANDDGYVSLAEAGADTRISRDFNRVDEDRDGRLDRKEFQAALEMSAAPSPSKETIMQAQQRLNAKGFDAGAVNGMLSSATRRALEDYQQAQGINATGELDRETLSALDIRIDK